jgi:hypothetical protein
MAFTVEDGTGLASANAYVSVEEANVYHKDRGNSAWVGASSQKQVAIIKATAYLEAMYRWTTGDKILVEQKLSWPRMGAYDRDGYAIEWYEVPDAVKEATAELALVALTTSLTPSYDRITRSEQIGPISVTYADDAVGTRYPLVDGILRGMASYTSPTKRGMGSIEIERG